MKTSVRPRLLNGQTGDPALHVTLRWQGRSLLIDLGRIDRTPAAVLLRTEAVYANPLGIRRRRRRDSQRVNPKGWKPSDVRR